MIKNVKNIFAVAAGKGGVGKSTTAVNLALKLKEFGFSIGILDADVYGPSLHQQLPEEVAPKQSQIDAELITPAFFDGIKMISMAHFSKPSDANAVRAPIANDVIGQFLHKVEWGNLDYLIIDFPPGTGDIQLTLLQQANISGALIVTTPQELALLDVRKTVQMFLQMHVPIVGVVENMSFYTPPGTSEKYYPFSQGGGERLSKEYALSFLGEIPLDNEITLAAEKGESLFRRAPASLGALAFHALAKKMVDFQDAHCHYFIREMKLEKESLFIDWSDGKKLNYAIKELQKLCPCARCKEERSVQEDVIATDVERLGNYAIQLKFNSGCSKGIYPFALLRRFVNEI